MAFRRTFSLISVISLACLRDVIYRLTEDEGVINRCGFNSHGLKVVQQRLKERQASPMVGRAGLVGINVGKNKLSEVISSPILHVNPDPEPSFVFSVNDGCTLIFV